MPSKKAISQSSQLVPAAQYLRASTNEQQYSIANQSAAIALYAAAHRIGIVQSFVDDGKSGAVSKGRRGLQDLLRAVESGHADFKLILVYDVSRWGRFANSDEAAHYEYLCTRRGIRIHYCAEQFANDASATSSLLKALRRTMAAEYSRELGIKIRASHCAQSRRGFKLGKVPYGLNRVLLDKEDRISRVLLPGERKTSALDRVSLAPGPAHETGVIRRIFDLCVEQHKTSPEIAGILNSEGIPFQGRLWSAEAINYILQNPAYVGTISYGRPKSTRGRRIVTPRESWVIKEEAFEKIVELPKFQTAQAILAARKDQYSTATMLNSLRRLWKENGTLTSEIINAARDVPDACTYYRHFGGLLEAYRLIGFNFRKNCPFANTVSICKVQRAEFLSDFTERVRAAGGSITAAERRLVRINDNITVRIILSQPRTKAGEATFWPVFLTHRKSTDIVIFVRLQPVTDAIADYYVFPRGIGLKRRFRIYEQNNRTAIEQCRMATLDRVMRALGRVSTRLLRPDCPSSETANEVRD